MACKKDKENPEPPTPDPVNVIGFWEGKYVDTSKDPAVEGYFAFELKADSSAIIYIDQKEGGAVSKENAKVEDHTTFKHLVDSKKITFAYTYDDGVHPSADLSTSGTLNTNVDGIAGTWGETPNETNRGTYTVTKK